MQKTAIRITAADHGRPMSLAEFDHAEVEEGHLYELSRGIITVSEVPGDRHFAQMNAIQLQIFAYWLAHANQIYRVGGGSDCKMLVVEFESERHPDWSIYKLPRQQGNPIWVPEIAIEVVSKSSIKRDYQEKPEEYLEFGVLEYWIVDSFKREMLVLRRSKDAWAEKTVRSPKIYKTALLPGFEFSCEKVFAAAEAFPE